MPLEVRKDKKMHDIYMYIYMSYIHIYIYFLQYTMLNQLNRNVKFPEWKAFQEVWNLWAFAFGVVEQLSWLT
jgi:L-cystine uptake protein TcyP (sodium:dicarboxylate symporter family)